MLATDEDDELIIRTKDVMPERVEMQRMIDSALHVFLEATLNRRIEAVVDTIVVS